MKMEDAKVLNIGSPVKEERTGSLMKKKSN